MSFYNISIEECDRITAHTLTYYKQLLEEQKNSHIHPNDVAYNKKLIKSINRVLDYFGDIDVTIQV